MHIILKALAAVGLVLTLFGQRYTLGLNPEIESWFRARDFSFGQFLAVVAKGEPVGIVQGVGKHFGILALLYTALLFLTGLLHIYDATWSFVLMTLLIVSLMIWLAIHSVMEFSRYSARVLLSMMQIPLLLLAAPLIDMYMHTGVTPAMYRPLVPLLAQLGIGLTSADSLLVQGLMCTLFLESIFIGTWLVMISLSWAFVSLALLIVATPIYLSRWIPRLSREEPLTILAVLVLTVVGLLGIFVAK